VGIVLGSLVFLIAVIVLIIVCLRRRRIAKSQVLKGDGGFVVSTGSETYKLEEGAQDDFEEDDFDDDPQEAFNNIMAARRELWDDPSSLRERRKSQPVFLNSGIPESISSKRHSMGSSSLNASSSGRKANRLSVPASVHYRNSVSSQTRSNRDSVISKTPSHRARNRAKHMSVVSVSSAIVDTDQLKREEVRNSWWSNTGVGKGVEDVGVLERQAARAAVRHSWWSGEQVVVLEDSDERRFSRNSGMQKEKRVSKMAEVEKAADDGSAGNNSSSALAEIIS
jgi:hypothetical protein